MIFDLDLWSLQILGIQHLAGRFIIGLGFPYNAFWNSPALGKLWFRSKRRRYQSVLDYLKLLKEEEPHRKIYVSGHSLGGGLAHLVASELQLPAVTLSAPGVVETAGLLGLEPLELQDLTVNVIPDRDPIPANSGKQGGVTVPIPCIVGEAPECHRVFNTICYMAATICNLLCHAARWSCLRSLAFTDQHILATWVGNTTHTHTNPSTCRHAAEAMWRSNPTQYTMQLLPDGGRSSSFLRAEKHINIIWEVIRF
ncbi:unnamed protein product [Durusdinium trenchii]|uniref:Fungal lipase-type domain-containing protein n=1 Tax=Durusdinium trenchii TaxID=1381693 RepID=A0ABP0QS09_9DINO